MLFAYPLPLSKQKVFELGYKSSRVFLTLCVRSKALQQIRSKLQVLGNPNKISHLKLTVDLKQIQVPQGSDCLKLCTLIPDALQCFL